MFSIKSAQALTAWTDIGPNNAVTVQILCHPTNGDVVFFVADSGHVYRSLDQGKSYSRVSQRVAVAVQPHRQLRAGEHCIAIDPRPKYANTVYYSPGSPGGGLWKSEKLGDIASWEQIGDKNMGQSVVTVNYDGHVIVLSLDQRVLISKDEGKTWDTLSTKFPFYFDKKAWADTCNWKVDLEVGIDNTLYLCDRQKGGGIWVSYDSGKSWENKINGTWFVDTCASPTTPGLALAYGREGEVYRSADAGKSWEKTAMVKHSYWKHSTWPMHQGGIGINHKGIVIAIGRKQMGISQDGGKTFSIRDEADIPWDMGDFIHERRVDMSLKCCGISASPVTDKLWYFGDGQILKKSVNDGESWFGAVMGLHGLWTYGQPGIDITNPNKFHVASVDAGHSYTTDHGKTWFQSKPTPKPESCQGIAQDPNNPTVFYKVHGYRKLLFYKSTDNGVTFKEISKLNLPDGTYMGRILIDPTDSNRIYFTQRGGAGVYRSDDGGKTFNLAYKSQKITHSLVTPNGNVYFRIWNGKGIFRYLKESDKWEEITGNQDVDGFAVHPGDENIVYFNSKSFPEMDKGTLYKTTNALDSNRKWEEQGKYGGMHLYIDPYKPQYMLMMTNQKNIGMMYSSDSGKNWKSIHNNHATSFIWGFVAGGPLAKGRVYTYDSVACYIDDLYNPEYTGPKYD